MFLVANHLTVGILFLVYLFLLCARQVPAIGFNVRVLLLLDGAIIGPQLLRFLLVERAILETLVDTLALVVDPCVDLVTSRVLHCKITAGRVSVCLCLGFHDPRARYQ
jgi:hypothetical protein